MYRESVGEKDNMVMKYAQAEQRNIELADRMAKMDAARREFLKEKELAVGRFRSVVTEKQRLQDLMDAKVCHWHIQLSRQTLRFQIIEMCFSSRKEVFV